MFPWAEVAAQLAVAEAASGDWMLRNVGTHAGDFIPVVRRMETKFKQPAQGKILGTATAGETEGRQLASDFAARRALALRCAWMSSTNRRAHADRNG